MLDDLTDYVARVPRSAWIAAAALALSSMAAHLVRSAWRRAARIDVGDISGSWLLEHRGQRDADPFN